MAQGTMGAQSRVTFLQPDEDLHLDVCGVELRTISSAFQYTEQLFQRVFSVSHSFLLPGHSIADTRVRGISNLGQRAEGLPDSWYKEAGKYEGPADVRRKYAGGHDEREKGLQSGNVSAMVLALFHEAKHGAEIKFPDDVERVPLHLFSKVYWLTVTCMPSRSF